MRRFLCSLFFCLVPNLPCFAGDLKVAGIFGDSMVLQRDKAFMVWGIAAANAEVTVATHGQRKTAQAGADGRWAVLLDPMQASSQAVPFQVIAGEQTINFQDVVIGEVWFAAGQSNMNMPVREARDAATEIAAAQYPLIRQFDVIQRWPYAKPRETTDRMGAWTQCSPEKAGSFSAVAYFFARELYRRLDVPIGIIHSSAGGIPAETMTPPDAIEGIPSLARLLGERGVGFGAGIASQEEFDELKARRKNGETTILLPDQYSLLGNLFNGMVAPFIPYQIRGVIWYQGEANTSRAEEYRELFPALIVGWRKHWKQPNLPFYFVQLAGWMKPVKEPGNDDWAVLREAQAMALKLPYTGMAVALDLGDEKTIHPLNKQEVGRRLSLLARGGVYGEGDLPTSGPIYESHRIIGGEVHIKFRETSGGLATSDGGPVNGFAIALADGKFVWAEARIEGADTIIVQSQEIDQPARVRYGWARNPKCNLVNKSGLPAAPFRLGELR